MGRRRLPALTVAIAAITAVVLSQVDFYRGESCSTSMEGVVRCTSSTQTLLEHEGSSVMLLLLAPAALALVGVIVPRRGVLVAIAAVFSVFVLVGMMSVGLFFVPTAVAALVAAGRATRSPGTSHPRPGTVPAA